MSNLQTEIEMYNYVYNKINELAKSLIINSKNITSHREVITQYKAYKKLRQSIIAVIKSDELLNFDKLLFTKYHISIERTTIENIIASCICFALDERSQLFNGEINLVNNGFQVICNEFTVELLEEYCRNNYLSRSFIKLNESTFQYEIKYPASPSITPLHSSSTITSG